MIRSSSRSCRRAKRWGPANAKAAPEPSSARRVGIRVRIRRVTFSLVAADPDTGEVGVAVQSKYFAVGAVVPWARAGVGAVATQAAGVAVYGPRILERLLEGRPVDDALADVLADDPDWETRQIGVVTADGEAISLTGECCIPWAGSIVRDHFAAQGNLLVGPEVVEEMVRAFEETEGPLGE